MNVKQPIFQKLAKLFLFWGGFVGKGKRLGSVAIMWNLSLLSSKGWTCILGDAT